MGRVAISSKLIKQFSETAVPEGAARHAVRTRSGWTTRSRGLTPTLVANHLHGCTTLAAYWGPRCRHFVIDIDNHGGPSVPPLMARLSAVLAAFEGSGVEPLIVRSSASGGLHVYHFLSCSADGPDLRERVLQFVARAGVEVAPGRVEVWPSSSALRLPLGQGSAVLCPTTLQPLHATLTCDGRLRRDVAASVELFVRLANANRAPIADLLGRRRAMVAGHRPTRGAQLAAVSPAAVSATAAPPGPSDRPACWAGTDWGTYIALLRSEGIPEAGYRNQAGLALVFQGFIREGRPKHDVLAELEQWLTSRQHVSKDLAADRAGTIRRMVLDLDRHIDRLAEQVRLGTLRRGGRGVAREREPAVADLKPTDVDFDYVARAASTPKLAAQLQGLLPHLSRVADEDGFVRCAFELPTSVLQKIAGKKAHAGVSDYRRLLAEAEQVLGLVRVARHSTGYRAAVYVFQYRFGSGLSPSVVSLNVDEISAGMVSGCVPGGASRTFQSARERAAVRLARARAMP